MKKKSVERTISRVECNLIKEKEKGIGIRRLGNKQKMKPSTSGKT